MRRGGTWGGGRGGDGVWWVGEVRERSYAERRWRGGGSGRREPPGEPRQRGGFSGPYIDTRQPEPPGQPLAQGIVTCPTRTNATKMSRWGHGNATGRSRGGHAEVTRRLRGGHARVTRGPLSGRRRRPLRGGRPPRTCRRGRRPRPPAAAAAPPAPRSRPRRRRARRDPPRLARAAMRAEGARRGKDSDVRRGQNARTHPPPGGANTHIRTHTLAAGRGRGDGGAGPGARRRHLLLLVRQPRLLRLAPPPAPRRGCCDGRVGVDGRRLGMALPRGDVPTRYRCGRGRAGIKEGTCRRLSGDVPTSKRRRAASNLSHAAAVSFGRT